MVSGFPGEEMARRILAFAALAVCGTTPFLAQQLPNYPDKPVAFSIGHPTAQHVILISIDGMHALDLANYVTAHPDSTLAELSRRGTTYTNAHTPWSDGAPGMVALATGGTPISTGILYSDAFDHSLSPPGS